ncbi:MAG: endopeptidase La [Armatimonadetes bacterium]|nr:endopeptidase La [Armatimonadota bacterium]
MSDAKSPVEEAVEVELKGPTLEVGPDEEDVVDLPETLNILPLRDSVIYPMLIAPLSVARASSVQLIDESVQGQDRIIGVVVQRDPATDEPGFDDIYGVGCAVIIRTLMKAGNNVRLIVQGMARFKIVEPIQVKPFMVCRVEPLEEEVVTPEIAEEVEALRRSVSALFEQAVRLSPMLPDELRSLTTAVQEPGILCDLVAAHVPLQVAEKQELLDTADLRVRMRRLLELLGKEVRVLELTSKVQSEVSTELSKAQRDYYLREQLKAIQKELGEDFGGADDLEELRQLIDAAGMSEAALKEVNREFDRLKRINAGSPEYSVARTYVETMAALPWNVSTTDNLDLEHVRKVLDEDHYGLDKIKRRIVEFLAVRKVKKDGLVKQPILCFYGPPGVGKTSLGRSIARAMDRKFVRLSLGGMRDEAEIRGHRRTYIGAMPGQVIQSIRRAECNNPVFVFDEIDKLGNDFRGDPASAMLEVLDPEQNSSFRDHYVDAPFDLSRVFFITTANRLDTIPPALRDRMEIIEITGYTEHEKSEIAARHLVPRQIEDHGLTEKQVSVEEGAILHIIQRYTREAGVRNLNRELGAVVRRATLMFAEGRKRKLAITKKFVESTLGAPRYSMDELAERSLIAGVALGLAWTPVGGEVLFVESTSMTGKKGLTITGQVGDVMKESVEAALSYVRSNAKKLKIDPEFFNKSDIHIHVPAGAVPKDGPSAGITMLTALVSLLTGRKVRPRLAMTGEITLTGQVLPVGGIKEKVLAAHRAGVKTLLLPAQNRKEYQEDVPQEIQDQIEVHFIRRVSHALLLALE